MDPANTQREATSMLERTINHDIPHLLPSSGIAGPSPHGHSTLLCTVHSESAVARKPWIPAPCFPAFAGTGSAGMTDKRKCCPSREGGNPQAVSRTHRDPESSSNRSVKWPCPLTQALLTAAGLVLIFTAPSAVSMPRKRKKEGIRETFAQNGLSWSSGNSSARLRNTRMGGAFCLRMRRHGRYQESG